MSEEDILWVKLLIGLFITIAMAVYHYKRAKALKSRVAFIEKYVFSISLKEKFKQKYPQLSEDGIQKVFIALKDFFFFCTDNHWHPMPSKVVDDAWHEFILHTKEYQDFCEGAFGRFLHHTPAEAFDRNLSANKEKDGLKKVWKAACEKEEIDRFNPEKLPLLFAIDKLLAVEGGYFYSHLENPLSGEISAHAIKCSSDSRWGSGCGGDCGGE